MTDARKLTVADPRGSRRCRAAGLTRPTGRFLIAWAPARGQGDAPRPLAPVSKIGSDAMAERLARFLWPIRWHLLVIAELIVLMLVNSLGSAVSAS
jgi:hypothetical protein